MLILLDCRPLQELGPDSEKSRFIVACAKSLSAGQAVEWLFLVDGACPADWLSDVPGVRLLTRRTFPGKRGWKIWYDWQIPLAVRRYRPDLVMTTAGIAAARMRVPQCVWMTERGDGKKTGKKKVTAVYAKRLERSLQQAQVLFSFSEKDKLFFTGRVSGTKIADKIRIVPPVSDTPAPLSPGEREKIKEQVTEGKEYFFTSVAGAGQKEVVDLLKAFSLFKKRQRSNMQLVLAGGSAILDKELAGLLATYKYRQDIHWTRHLPEEERGRLAGGAYAILFPFDRDSLGLHILNAWKAGVPVITTAAALLPEAGEAVLPTPPGDPAALAGQLMSIYKDEGLRSSLIEKGAEREHSFSWERSAGEVWAGILAINS